MQPRWCASIRDQSERGADQQQQLIIMIDICGSAGYRETSEALFLARSSNHHRSALAKINAKMEPISRMGTNVCVTDIDSDER